MTTSNLEQSRQLPVWHKCTNLWSSTMHDAAQIYSATLYTSSKLLNRQLQDTCWDKLSNTGKQTIISKLRGYFNQTFASFSKSALKTVCLAIGKQKHICFAKMNDENIKTFQHDIIVFETFQAGKTLQWLTTSLLSKIQITTMKIQIKSDLATYITTQKDNTKNNGN